MIRIIAILFVYQRSRLSFFFFSSSLYFLLPSSHTHERTHYIISIIYLVKKSSTWRIFQQLIRLPPTACAFLLFTSKWFTNCIIAAVQRLLITVGDRAAIYRLKLASEVSQNEKSKVPRAYFPF